MARKYINLTILLSVNWITLKPQIPHKPQLFLYGLATRSYGPQPLYGVSLTNTVGPRCKCFSKCSCRCTPNALSCAPTAQFSKSCRMYLAFSSCGCIAKKHWVWQLCLPSVYTASWPGQAWPWDSGVQSGRCGPRRLSCVTMPGLCLLTAQRTGLIPNVIPVLPMACYLSAEQFWTLQLCQIRPKLYLTLASCRWQSK